MSVAVTLLLAVLAILPGQTHDTQMDVATAQRMQQREEFLRQEMTRLWQETEQIMSLEKAFLHSLLHWLLYTAAAAVLTDVCKKLKPDSSCHPEQDNSSSEEEDDDYDDDYDDEEHDDEEDGDLNAYNGVRSLAWPTLFSVQELPDPCRNVRQVLCDLISQEFPRSTFMSEIYPHTGMNGALESWRVHKH